MIIKSEIKAKLQAEINSIKEHLESITTIKSLNLNKFDGKVLNVKFSKALNISSSFTLYAKNCTQQISDYTCTYSDLYRNITIKVPTINNRIDLNAFYVQLNKLQAELKEALKDYQKRFKNYGKNKVKIDNKVAALKAFCKTLNREDANYLKKELRYSI